MAGDGGSVPLRRRPSYGSLAGRPSNAGRLHRRHPVGPGYWLAGSNGGVFPFGDAVNHGEAARRPATPITADRAHRRRAGVLAPRPRRLELLVRQPAAQRDLPRLGRHRRRRRVPGAARSGHRYFCNPYGPCEEWCALFATWAWQQGGWRIPSYAFTGYIFDWAAATGACCRRRPSPVPGDAVLFGTGPASTATSVHVGIVAQVWPDGAIVTIEGDAGPGASGSLAVVINGPFLPSDSLVYNGFPVYAFAQP